MLSSGSPFYNPTILPWQSTIQLRKCVSVGVFFISSINVFPFTCTNFIVTLWYDDRLGFLTTPAEEGTTLFLYFRPWPRQSLRGNNWFLLWYLLTRTRARGKQGLGKLKSNRNISKQSPKSGSKTAGKFISCLPRLPFPKCSSFPYLYLFGLFI